MDALELIRSRRSTRSFLNKKVEEEKLENIIEAGRYAPSGGNSQTTHFIVIKNKDVLNNLAKMVQDSFSKMEEKPGMYKSIVSSIRRSKTGNYIFHYNPDVLIVCANKIDYGNNIADVACALENMMLMANALDLGSVWINQLKWLNEDESINEYLYSLGLNKDERVYGALAVGYSTKGLPERNPLERTGNVVTVIE